MQAPFFHVGMVVADIEAAQQSFALALGVDWTGVEEREMPVRTAAGVSTALLRFCYSVQGPPHLELVQSTGAEPWVGMPPGVHHVGLWSPDLAADAARLEADGFGVRASGVGRREGPVGFTYHDGPAGVLLELVDERSRPAFGRWLAGGRYA